MGGGGIYAELLRVSQKRSTGVNEETLLLSLFPQQPVHAPSRAFCSSNPVMEQDKRFVPLQPEGIEILKRSRSAFCRVLEGKFGCTAQIHNVEDYGTSAFSHSKPSIVSEIMYRKQLSKNLTVSVWKDDLTTHKVDAVVNAANEHLNHGGGLALALSQAGGPMIQQWSNDIIKQKGKVCTGDVVSTQAGNLPCNMIIHAVGPCVSPNPSKSELNKASELLYKTILSVLRKANYENLQSVAIPAISSGLYNFPVQDCANIIVRAVQTFRDGRNPGSTNLDVRLVNYDDPSVQQMYRACMEILGPSDQMTMQTPSSTPSQSVVSCLDLGNVTLYLKKGAIEEERTDVIVNTIGSDLDLSKGLVSAALLKRAGRNMQDEIKRDPYAHGFEGDVIPTAGHLLNCKAVYHTVCAPKKYGPDQILHSVVTKCLLNASRSGFSSISFPALGTGNLGLKKDEVSQIMTTAVLQFSDGYNGSKMKIFFVIFPKDTDKLKVQAFEKQMASTKTRQKHFPIPRSTNGKSSVFYDMLDNGKSPCIELLAPSPEALREAKRWTFDMMHKKYDNLKIFNNHVVYLSHEDHEKLMSLQGRFKVVITEFFKEGKGGIIINGEPVDVNCAVLEVEAMLCAAQDKFAREEEGEMQRDLALMNAPDRFGQIEKISYKKPVDLNSNDWDVKDKLRNFSKCGLSIVKMENIENPGLMKLFEVKRIRLQATPRRMYQCVKAQFCDLICRVGFQREYAPPKEQKYGAGIYFTSEVDEANALWTDYKDTKHSVDDEYIYIIEALVFTGKAKRGAPEMIVPPPTDQDPLVRYNSVTGRNGIYVIFNGQQAFPRCLITCKTQNI